MSVSHVARGLPSKVLIANRGEIAVRIARTCRAMGIGTVAVHSDVDAGALHVEVCDEAVRLGGASPAESYLRGDALVEAALRTGAEAIHPGYGFLSEAAGFARQVLDAGLTWVGPSPEAIAAMGDKLAAKARMAAAGVPLVPGMDLTADLAEVTDLDLDHVAAEIGFPVMVKAAAGGGGKGMRVVSDPAELHDAIAAARREAGGAFGDDRVFLERYVAHPRHLEVQVIGDTHGTVLHLFERECSVQRRHQKVVEETPSPGITDAVRAALGEAAVAAARAIGYVNAGTIEFIADDAVLARLRSGDGRRSARRVRVPGGQHPPAGRAPGHRGGRAGARPVDRWARAAGPGAAAAAGGGGGAAAVRAGRRRAARPRDRGPALRRGPDQRLPAADRHAARVRAGGVAGGAVGLRGARRGQIPTYYDPMLAKVIAWAPSRREAAGLLARELDTSVLVGATTNRDLLVGVLRDPVFLAGDTTTSFLGSGSRAGCRRVPPRKRRTVTLMVQVLTGKRRVRSGSTSAERTALIATALAGAVDRRRVAPVLATLPAGFTNAGAFDPSVVLELGDPGNGTAWTVRYGEERDGSWRVRLVPGDEPEDAGPHPDATEHHVLLHAPPRVPNATSTSRWTGTGSGSASLDTRARCTSGRRADGWWSVSGLGSRRRGRRRSRGRRSRRCRARSSPWPW
jgi:propionyl-CoA carboxylase alpha chain